MDVAVFPDGLCADISGLISQPQRRFFENMGIDLV